MRGNELRGARFRISLRQLLGTAVARQTSHRRPFMTNPHLALLTACRRERRTGESVDVGARSFGLGHA